MYQDSELPKTIADGQYRLKKRIGQGGMAVVYVADVDISCFDFAMVVAGHEAASGSVEERQAYRAAKYQSWKLKSRDELLAICTQFKLPYPSNGDAAVKVMIPQQREDAAIRFEAEWRQLLAINHPHLIKVYGGGREAGLPWYSMEVVRNIIPLKEARALPDRAKLDMVFQAAGGLQALHQRGIIHRDIKPANLLCSREGDGVRVRVMDLGIAKLTASTEGLTLSHHVMGTPYYMSPEQAGSSKNVDHRADVYSLGATLYSLICGARPYEGKSMYEVVGSLVRGESPERPSDVNEGIDKWTALLIERMMDLDADRRLQTMEEVRAAIQAVFAGNEAKCAEMLKGKEKPRRAASRRPASSSDGRASSGTRQRDGSRASRQRRGYQGTQRREIAMGPLIAGGVAVIVLLIAIIIALSGGGGEGSPTGEEWTPGMGTVPGGSGSGSASAPGSQTASGSEAGSGSGPMTREQALAKLKTRTQAILGLIEEGRLRAADAQVDSLLDLATEFRLEEEVVPLKDEIATARGAFLDKLADEALQAVKDGDKEKAKALHKQLRTLDDTHGKVTEIGDAIRNMGKPAVGSGSGSETSAPGDDLTIREGARLTAKHFSRIDGEFKGFIVKQQGVGAGGGVDVKHFGLQSIALQGDTVVATTRQNNGYLRLRMQFQGPSHFKFRLQVKVSDGRLLHFHQAFYPPAIADHRALDQHFGVNHSKLATILTRYELPDIRTQQAAEFDWVLILKEKVTYTFGRTLVMVPLFVNPKAPDAAELAKLRKAQQFQQALDLVEASAETARQRELQLLRARCQMLAHFERYVRYGGAIQNRKVGALKSVVPSDAIALHRAGSTVFRTPKAEAARAIREAAYLWELRQPGARAAAESAVRLGAGPAADALLAEIKAAGGK